MRRLMRSEAEVAREVSAEPNPHVGVTAPAIQSPKLIIGGQHDNRNDNTG
jgi:hypothetical protein